MNKKITQSLFKSKLKSVVNVIFLFTMLLLLNSCGTEPKDELNKIIKSSLRKNNKIDEKQWSKMNTYIIANKEEFSYLLNSDNEVDTSKLTDYITTVASNRRRNNGPEPEIFNPNNNTVVEDKPIINVYIENSGSMDGYVRGITDFEIAIGKILVLSKDYNDGGLNVNFINKNVYPAPQIKELTDFAKALEPKKGSPYYDKGDENRYESILNDVVKNILDSISDNNVSILVSDCIYSLEQTKDTKGSLGYQQNGTMEAFLNKFKKTNINIATNIYKMSSNFKGKYYPYNYKRKLHNYIYIDNKQRPYYIWIIGSNKNVNQFIKKIKIETLKGFENSYYLSSSQEKTTPFYTILKETNKIGNFKPIDRRSKYLTNIKSIEYNKGKLQFAIAIDLSNIPVDKPYLLNTSNYTVPDGFTIETIEKINRENVKRRDYITVEKTNATHIITVATSSKYSLQDLSIKLSNKIPTWVETSSSIDDTDINKQLDKTFGLLYLVQGVSEAYTTQNPANKSYFNINITIKK